ncbi:MAG: glycosyltransferase [Acidimicrobiales bacterium]|nr:glycosyltransferase [Acidimicrobiales bacterium]
MDPETDVPGAPVAPVAPAEAESPEPPADAAATVPAVVAVVVTHDPGDWFEETLRSLADQTYPDLSVLVVDTASAVDPTERVHAVLPRARVHLVGDAVGFGAAANLATEMVEGASFYAFLHDDVALEPDTIRMLVEEAFRSNAGVIGPKLVDWNEPERLLQVGMGVDKTGVMSAYAEPGELDQEQHDAVRDVFVVPGACTVIRADLFAELGGYDDGIDFLGEDLDLCWRAHVVGARVMIAPAARTRHLESLGHRLGVDDRRRRFARHRLRTTSIAYGRWHRLRVMPQAFVFMLLEVLYGIVTGRPDQSRDVAAAWPWNIRRRRQIRERRRRLASVRRVTDKEVRALQVRGSARVNAFVRAQIHRRDDKISTTNRSTRGLGTAVREGSRQFTGVFAIVLGIVLVVSSRGLILDGIPAIGDFSLFPSSPGTFLSTWTSGWRPAGLGSPGPQPTAYGLLTVASYVFLGATGLLRDVLIIGCIPIGALGAWRLARPIGSARASVAAFAVYLAIPVPYNALASGSWSGLLMYAASPWLLLLLGRATGVAPFGPVHAERGESFHGSMRRKPLALILGLGLLLGVVGAFVPFVVVVVGVMTIAYVVGSLLCFRIAGISRLLLVTVLASAVAAALNSPWILDLARADSPWGAFAGVGATSGGGLSLGEILRFETGPWGAPPLGWAFIPAAMLPVVIGRSWRLDWAVRAWFVVGAGWVSLWAAERGDLSFALPPAEVILAPVAAALAFTAALGLAAFESDLRAYRFGWRQILSVLAAVGVVAGAIPLGAGLVDGRWRTPTSDYASSYDELFDQGSNGGFRVLWLGDQEVLPAGGWRYDEQLSYAATSQGAPTVLDRFTAGTNGATEKLADAMHIADERRTNRLGHLLAPMGVRYVVVTERLSPSTTGGAVAVPTRIRDALAQQLDLREIPVRDGITIYENAAWMPMRAVLPGNAVGPRDDPSDAVSQDLTQSTPALTHADGPDRFTGTVPRVGDLLVSATADPAWKLQIDGMPMQRSTAFGWANQFDASGTGRAVLTFDTPLTHRLAVGVQVLFWVFVLWLRRRLRISEKRIEANAEEVTA